MSKRSHLNPIQARGHFVPPHRNHSISSKRLGVWSYCFVTFFSMYFLFRKFCSTNQPSCMLPWQPYHFQLNFENSKLHCFQVFSPERNFLWDNLCFGHHNSLISSIKVNIRIVPMETFQNILLPKYGHRH